MNTENLVEFFIKLSPSVQTAIILAICFIVWQFKNQIAKHGAIIVSVLLRQKKLSDILSRDVFDPKSEGTETEQQGIGGRYFRRIKTVVEPNGINVFPGRSSSISEELNGIFAIARVQGCEITILFVGLNRVNKHFCDGIIESVRQALEQNNIAVKIIFPTNPTGLVLDLQRQVNQMVSDCHGNSVCCEIEVDQEDRR